MRICGGGDFSARREHLQQTITERESYTPEALGHDAAESERRYPASDLSCRCRPPGRCCERSPGPPSARCPRMPRCSEATAARDLSRQSSAAPPCRRGSPSRNRRPGGWRGWRPWTSSAHWAASVPLDLARAGRQDKGEPVLL